MCTELKIFTILWYGVAILYQLGPFLLAQSHIISIPLASPWDLGKYSDNDEIKDINEMSHH